MLHEIVTAMRRATRRALTATRNARSEQARTIREHLRGHRRAMVVAVRTVLAVPGGSPAGEPTTDSRLQARVLQEVEAHPDGVRVRDVGNELGVDWRQVLGVMNALVLRGVVDRIDQNFYAAGKASRRC